MDDYDIGSFLQSLDLSIGGFEAAINDQELIDSLKECDPVLAAGYFSGLLSTKKYQANNYLLSMLVHGSLLVAKGKEDIDFDLAKNLFAKLGHSLYGRMQDPPEDTLTASVHLFGNSFSLFEGTWEANSFHTQTFLYVLELMPNDGPFSALKKSIFSLLSLSKAISDRMKYGRYEMGDETIHEELIIAYSDIQIVRKPIVFNEDELSAIGINIDELAIFCFDSSEFPTLANFQLGETDLEVKPLVKYGNEIFVLLPDSIGPAIRYYIIDWCHKRGNLRKALLRSFKRVSLGRCIEEVGGMADYSFNLYCSQENNIRDAEIIERLIEFDSGRYLHQVFIFDDFSDYQNKKFIGSSDQLHELPRKIVKSIKHVKSYLESLPGFKNAITLIVVNGWGRQLQMEFDDTELDEWKIEYLSGYDFSMMFSNSENNLEEFWRFIQLKDKSEASLKVFNPSGIFNLWAWAKDNRNHIINHDKYPLDMTPEEFANSVLVLAPNTYLDQRLKIKKNRDAHFEQTPDGTLVLFQRVEEEVFFNEDACKPIYASVSHAVYKAELLGLVYSMNQKWWCSPIASRETDWNIIYKLWSCILNWIFRITDVGKEIFESLPFTDVLCNFHFNFQSVREARSEIPTDEELRSMIDCEAAISNGKVTVTLSLNEEYIYGFQQATNNAEKILIEGLIKGVLSVFYDSEKVLLITDQLVSVLFSSDKAKYFHIMHSNRVRHYSRKQLSEPLLVNRYDIASYKVGSLWLSHPIGTGPKVIGKKECCQLIREHTDILIDLLVEDIASFNKDILIEKLLLNLDAIGQSLDRWNMTFAASESLRKDKESVFEVTSLRINELQEASISTRILLEMAVCHAGQNSSMVPGNIDISRMLSVTSVILALCGWSDQIHYEAIPSEIHVAPTGDLRIDHTFFDETMQSYGNIVHRVFTDKSKSDYVDQYLPYEEKKFEPGTFPDDFERSWFEEFGFSIYDGRDMMLQIEEHSIKLRTSILMLSRAEFVEIFSGSKFTMETISAFLANYSLFDRQVWKEIDHAHFTIKEVQPWRFRRRLSFVSRPILQYDEKIIVHADSLVKGFNYFLRSCYFGSFEDRQFLSRPMKKWIGRTRDENGHAFNKEVAKEFAQYGWKSRFDMKLTELLQSKLEKDYGDIDVVAWNEATGEVLLIECKDLLFAKTPGEIAKQIYDFRGLDRPDGKPDRLKKHLIRINKLIEHSDLLRKSLRLSVEPVMKPYLLFKNTVPIQFSNHEALSEVGILTFTEIEKLRVP